VLAAIIICELAGIVGSIFTFQSVRTWYVDINKPSFTPPSWIFGPVWTILYALMGISLYLIWKNHTKNKSTQRTYALTFFFIQLILNTIWSIIFFGLQQPFYAFIEIIFLWVSILITIFYAFKVSKGAGYLLLPYLAWVSFASILNFAIFYLNS